MDKVKDWRRRGGGLFLRRGGETGESPFLSAKVCRDRSQLDLPVVLGQEAVVRVGQLQGCLVVAQHHLLLFLSAVLQRVGVHLMDVPLDGADLQRGQSGRAHHADEPVPAAVVIHQVLHPPAHLVVPPLVLPGVMAVTQGCGRGAAVPSLSLSSAIAICFHLVLLCLSARFSDLWGLVHGIEDLRSAQVGFY